MVVSGGGSSWEQQVKEQIRRRYAALNFPPDGANRAVKAGYPAELIAQAPDWLTASYAGCGYLFDDIALQGDEVVVDLGCGAGLDSYFASRMLADEGRVIAIDMTMEMLALVEDLPTSNIYPLAGDIEYLPVADGIADLVIANASFNLTLDKNKAFGEAYRVLKKGGRLEACDLVKDGDLPPEILTDPLSYNTSLGGALEEEKLIAEIKKVGFADAKISGHRPFSYVHSVKIEARKPL